MEYLQDIYPLARIVYSSILKRWDEDDSRGEEINSYMRRVCRQNPNFGYLDIRGHFQDEGLFRHSETQDYDNPDVVHLSAKGTSFSLILYVLLSPLPNLRVGSSPQNNHETIKCLEIMILRNQKA